MGAWLRRLLHRPPTVADCIRAALRAPCEPLRAPEDDPRNGLPTKTEGQQARQTVVDWVERTRQAHAAHEARWADNEGWEDLGIVWGEFTPEDV